MGSEQSGVSDGVSCATCAAHPLPQSESLREQQERDKELAEKRKTAQLEMQRQLEELRATQSTKQASDEPKVGGLGLMGRLGRARMWG